MKIMKKVPTATIEDYLGIIYTLQRDGEEVIGARLAEIMHVSAPTVTVTLKRMLRDGWIKIDDRKRVALTESGNDAARSVLRRHMLTEWLLSRVLNIPLSELHEEAHKIEHTLSPMVEEQLISSLDDPNVCPHGNPLPGQEMASQDWLPLTAFGAGSVVVIRRIHELLEEDYSTMSTLAQLGIQPGVTVHISANDKTKNLFEVILNDHLIQLSFETAEKLFAENPPGY
jgi:DtxR family Mn-dependent transcriptional regulator